MQLWDFALTVYQSDTIKQRCLELQDDYGVDICLLLGFLWMRKGGCRLAQFECSNLVAELDDWQRTKTQAIRALRRRVKRINGVSAQALSEVWYDAVLKLELQAEHMALNRIEHIAVNRWNLILYPNATQQWRLPMDLNNLGQALDTYLHMREVPQLKVDCLYACLLGV